MGLSQNNTLQCVCVCVCVCVHSGEETCHPVQQCGSLMSFNSVFDSEEEAVSGCDTHTILISTFTLGLSLHRKIKNITRRILK